MNSKRIFSSIVSCVFSASVILGPFIVKTTIAENKLESLREKSAKLSQTEARLNQKLDNLITNGASNNKIIKVIKQQEDILCEEIDIENEKAHYLNKEIEVHESCIKKTEVSIRERMNQLKKRVRAIFKAGGETAFIGAVLKAGSIKNLLSVAGTVQSVGRYDAKLFDELRAEIKRLEDEKQTIEAQKNEVEESMDLLEEKRENLEKLQRKYDNSFYGETYHSSNLSNGLVMGRSGKYLWPVPGYSMITAYWGDGRGHKGIDISGSGVYGAAIIAAADGVVVKTNSTNQWGQGWGYYVKIDHGNGFETQYAHCSVVAVSEGQRVEAGQVIGYVGNTGDSSGAHLHFETWKDGVRYDPMTEL